MSYEQGFADKCAEYGVDPAGLLKAGMQTSTLLRMVRSGLSKGGDRAQAADILRKLMGQKRIFGTTVGGKTLRLSTLDNKALVDAAEKGKVYGSDVLKPDVRWKGTDPSYAEEEAPLAMDDYFNKSFQRIFSANR